MDLIDLAAEEHLARQGRDGVRLVVFGFVAIGEFGDEPPPCDGDELCRLAAGGNEHRRVRIELGRQPEDVAVERAAEAFVGGDENHRTLPYLADFLQGIRKSTGLVVTLR